jgi:hypothetical protein
LDLDRRSLRRKERLAMTMPELQFDVLQSRAIRRLAPALALVALIVPSSAPAAQRLQTLQRDGTCTLTLNAGPEQLTAGEGAALSGALSCATPEEAAEQTVTVYAHSVGIHGFFAGASATTLADGTFTLHTEALSANTILYVSAQGARSPRVRVEIAPHVSVEAPPSGTQLLMASHHASAASLPATNTVTFKGTVSGAPTGTRVVLQRERPGGTGEWRRLALGEVDDEGHFTITHTFTIPGSTTVRILARGHGITPGPSEPLTYTIERQQRSGVSIHA